MLTPQEIADKRFDKVLVGGYDMAGVDAFLEAVEADYSQLYKENALLKNKMKVLVQKIEEYQSMDESMRKALTSAQNMASSIIEKAKAESVNIENEARAKAEGTLASYAERIAAEEMRLEETKTGVQAFVERMLAMYEQELDALRKVRSEEFHADAEAEPVAAAAERPVSAVIADVVDNAVPPAQPAGQAPAALPDTSRLPNLPPIPAPPEQTKAPQQAQVYGTDLTPNTDLPNSVKRAVHGEDDEEVILLTPKPRFEFDDLQFGENYDGGVRKKK